MTRKEFFRRVGLILLQILLTLLLITFLIPALWMFSSGLKVSTEVFAHPIVWIPESPRWANYAEIFQLPGIPFGRFIWNTFRVTTIAVIGTIISSSMVAYSFSRLNWPGRDFFFAMLLATMMLPEVIMLIPRFIIFRNLGWIDTLLPITVPYWFAITPIYVFLIRQFFKGIPIELEEAARIDGASRMRILAQIILPLSKPVIASVAVFALLQHYNDYLNPLIYINDIDLWTLPLGIAALNADESMRATWQLLFAASTIMVLPVILVFIFAQRYFVQGIAMTGFGGR
jgi:multiple sugar transport system permease protein/sn-glycerol 3-phosphate transport system permease protein